VAKNVRAKGTDGKRPRRAKDNGARTGDEAVLWARVLRACEAEFQETFGIAWDPILDKLGQVDNKLESEARRVYFQLHRALEEAVSFAERPEVKAMRFGARAVLALRDWVPRSIAPILRQTWMADRPKDREQKGRKKQDMEQRWPALPKDRARLVRILDDFNILGLPENPDGSSRLLTVREMALVSLLAGNRLKLGGGPLAYTAAEVIKLEVTNMRPLLAEHGRPDIAEGERGPRVERPRQKPPATPRRKT